MLQHLTNYLLQYKTVCVPELGTLRLVQKPPCFNVVDKCIEPPVYTIELDANNNLSEHQVVFLSGILNQEKEATAQELRSLGKRLRQQVSDSGFDWEGLGRFTHDTREVVLNTPALERLPVQKVIRQDVGHSVLVGDKEVSSAQVFERVSTPGSATRRRKNTVWIGWVVLAILLVLVFLVLYFGKFRTTAAGSRLPPTGWIHPNF